MRCTFCFFRYRTLGHTASQSRTNTFFLLLDLMQFFDLYHAGQLDTALDVSLAKGFVFAFIFYCSVLLHGLPVHQSTNTAVARQLLYMVSCNFFVGKTQFCTLAVAVSLPLLQLF